MAMMIQKFHRLIQSRVVWGVFLILVCIAFVGLYTQPAGRNAAAAESAAAGEYNGELVMPEELQHHYRAMYLRYTLQQMQPPSMTPELEEALRAEAWSRLVALKTAEEMGLLAGDQEVIDRIKQNPTFAQEGRFSQSMYQAFVQQFLARIGFTEPQFEQYTREEQTLAKLRYAVAQGGLVPPLDLKQHYSMLRDEFVVEYVLLKEDDVKDEVTVTEEEAKAYFEANPEPFEIPQKVDVRMVQYAVVDFLDEVEPIEEDLLRESYESNIERFTYTVTRPKVVEETVTIEEVEVTEEVEVVEDDGIVIESLTEDTATGEEVEVDGVVTEETDVVVTEETDVAEDVVAEVEEVEMEEVSEVQPYEEVRELILDSLARAEARNLAAEQATDFAVAMMPDRNGKAPTFDETATEFGREVVDLAPFSQFETLHGLGITRPFMSAAFALEDDPEMRVSDAIMAEDAVYVLELEKIIPPQAPAFEDIKERAMEMALQEAVLKRLEDRSFEIVDAADKALAEGKPFADGMKAEGLSVERTEPYTASTGMATLEYSDVLMQATLDRNAGELTEVLPTADGNYILAYVVERKDADPTGFSMLRDQIQSTLRQRQVSSLLAEWQEYLRNEVAIKDRAGPVAEEEEGEEANPEATDEETG